MTDAAASPGAAVPKLRTSALASAATGIVSPRDLGMTTLPGYLPTRTVASPRRQNFQVSEIGGGAAMRREKFYPMASSPRSPRPSMADRFSTTSSCYGAGSPRPLVFSPRFVELDKKVLYFSAYFQEAVDESSSETHRYRRCALLYYLEDNSLCIQEPKEINSGIPQGCFLKRHQVPSSARGTAGSSMPMHWSELRVGADVDIYSRTYHIAACDGFTRRFFEEQAQAQAPDQKLPVTPGGALGGGALSSSPASPRRGVDGTVWAGKHASPLKAFMEASLGKFSHDSAALAQYIKCDGHVLRFQCTWDDRSTYGEKLEFTLLYYLADGTIQILENRKKNDGRDPYPTLLERRRLAKSWEGELRGDMCGAYYGPKDLLIGSTVQVFSRTMRITSCDGFTRKYYSDTMGTPQPADEPDEAPTPPPPRADPPPHSGYGTEEDSMGSVQHVGLPPFRMVGRDFKKFMAKDGQVLRYEAKLDTTRPEDRDRKLIIAFYLADDTQAIYEPVQRNSGIVGGKFLERNRYQDAAGHNYVVDDLYVGAKLQFCGGVTLEIIAVDEFTRKYLDAQRRAAAPAAMDVGPGSEGPSGGTVCTTEEDTTVAPTEEEAKPEAE